MPSTHPSRTEPLSILLLGLGGNVTQGILKALRCSSLQCRLIGACVSPYAAGLYFCDAAYISPYAINADFLPWLMDICWQERIALVVSGVEEILEVLAQNKAALQKETNAVFLTSSPGQLYIGRDKLSTCLWLKDNGFAYPRFCLPDDSDSLKRLALATHGRLIAKPRQGKGSQGIVRSTSVEEALQLAALADYIIEEEIGEDTEEYTAACYRHRQTGEVSVMAMRRQLTTGTTSAAVVSENEKVLAYAKEICEKFAPEGPLNIQLRLNDRGDPVCFELNVRFSGTTPIRAHFGFRDVEAAVREYALNEDAANCFNVRPGMALRYWNEIYVDSQGAQIMTKENKLANAHNYACLDSQLLENCRNL